VLSRDWAKQSGEFADRINGIPKFVFSSRLEKADWNNATIVRGDVVDEIRKLKERDGTDLALYGHGLLGQTLLKAGLLDEFRISLFPVVVGRGKLLFREGERARLQLLEATSLPKGVVVVRYAPGQ
jgi:dihydrofolate reductase